jgi:hypothetical protein
MALQIRRGTDAQRQTTIFKSGELIYTTDTKDLWAGDNVTSGGTQIAPVKSVNGSTGTVVLTTDQVTQGSTNKYYTATQARMDSGAALVGGNAGNTGITFSYNSGSNTVTAIVTAGGYSLPIAAPTVLGGVKVNAGGLQIDGAGLLSAVVPVSAGVSAQLPYYTGTNSIGPSGTGLTWAPTNVGFSGGVLTVAGTIQSGRLILDNNLAENSLAIITQSGGTSGTADPFLINSYHNDVDATGIFLSRAKGTFASPTTLANNDAIFTIGFAGRSTDGTSRTAVAINASVGGTVGAGIVPGKLSMFVADTGGSLVNTLFLDATKVNITGNLVYSGLKISPANFITVATSTTYALSTTQTKNILLVTTGSLTATLTMPTGPVDGQLCIISVHTTNVTLAMTSGPTLSGAFAGAVTAPTTFEYIYRSSGTAWYRIR